MFELLKKIDQECHLCRRFRFDYCSEMAKLCTIRFVFVDEDFDKSLCNVSQNQFFDIIFVPKYHKHQEF